MLVQFGLMREFIRHLQKYPVQLNSEEELPIQMKQLAQYVYYIMHFAFKLVTSDVLYRKGEPMQLWRLCLCFWTLFNDTSLPCDLKT